MSAIRNSGLSAMQHPASAGGSGGRINEAAPSQVKQWLQDGQCVLIDVREADEHARERIAGSNLLPLSRFDPAQAAALVKPGQSLILHCRSGRRAADACRIAASLHASLPVLNMTGGIEAWKKEGLSVEIDTRISGISVMRQVQLVIGAGVLVGSALAWFLDPRFIAIPAILGAGLTFAGVTGTCGLAAAIARMPWNRTSARAATCAGGTCG